MNKIKGLTLILIACALVVYGIVIPISVATAIGA